MSYSHSVRIIIDRFLVRWLKLFLVAIRTRHIHGKNKIQYNKNQTVAITLCRNSEVYINSFIQHYLGLGVSHIIIMDNDSTDNTVNLARKYPQVSIYSCTLKFKEYNLLMRQYLFFRFGLKNHWVLNVDIDELFDYPCSDKINLGSFLAYLEHNQYTSVIAYMLDMFPDCKISSLNKMSDNLKSECIYYDISSVKESDYPEKYPYLDNSNNLITYINHNNHINNSSIKYISGGIRKTLFALKDVCLIKHPLIYKNGKTEIGHPHFTINASLADITGVLYHYKFTSNLQKSVEDAVINKQYWNNSEEYKKYHDILNKKSHISFKTNSSKRLTDINELVDINFVLITEQYKYWCSHNNLKSRYAE